MIASRGGSGMGSISRLRQSISSALSRLPLSEASWSMIPHGTPVAAISASWQARASSSGGSEKPATSHSASPAATSSAALDERPPPTGIVELTVASMPTGSRPRSASVQTTPAT